MSRIQKTILPGGVRVVTEHIPHVKSVSLGVWLNTGSRDENKRHNGISHFFEHMVFKGTKTRGALEIASELERVGGQLNAFTGKEQICFYACVLDEHVPLAVDLLCDLVVNPVLRPTDIDLERSVVLEEIHEQADNPEEHVIDLLYESLWSGHPIGRPITGDASTVGRFAQNHLFGFHKSALRDGDVMVAVAGNVRHREITQQVSRALKVSCGRRNGMRKAPQTCRGSRKILFRDVKQVHFALGFPGVSFGDHRRYALNVLNTLLGEGMSSRLFQKVREEKGLAYSVYSFLDFFIDAGIIGISASTEPEHFADCQRVIYEELALIRSKGISKDELSFAKSSLKGGLFIGLESTSHRMTRLARMEFYQNRIDSLEETEKEINRVTLKDVAQLSRELFQSRNLCVCAIAPREFKKRQSLFDISMR